MASMTYHVIKH